jgi:SAM-dependent methyltransferase
MPVKRTALLPLALLILLIPLAPQVRAQEWDYGEGLDVPYVPTPYEVVRAMLKLGGAKSGDFVVDLGCGDGRIVVTAAKEFGARGMGYDLNPERIKEANAGAVEAGVQDKVRFVEKNLFEAEIKDATLVTLYLLPSVNEKLKPRLLKELKPGTRVVSHSFDMGDWKPDKEEDINGRRLYLWTIPARK